MKKTCCKCRGLDSPVHYNLWPGLGSISRKITFLQSLGCKLGGFPELPSTRDMDAAEAKRRKITFFKEEETANKALQAAGWKLDETEGSQVLIPPSPDVEEGVEQSEGENEDQGGISECQVEESTGNN